MAATGTLTPPAPAPTRPRVVLVGSAFAAAAAFVGVIGMLGFYLSARADTIASGNTWLPDGANIPLTPSNMAFGTMLLSGFTVAWVVAAVRRNDRPSAYLGYALTFLFGIAVINATVFIIKVSNIPVSSETGVYFYGVIGAHLVMMIAGLLYLLSQAIRTMAGEQNREALVGASIFWYATVAAHAAIWLAIYITK